MQTPKTSQGLSNRPKVSFCSCEMENVFQLRRSCNWKLADITSGGWCPTWRLHYYLCNTAPCPLGAGSEHMTTMFKGVIDSLPDKRTLCNLPHAPVCCVSAITFGETPRRQTQAITCRSYNHQNKLAGIRVCPVTTPFNKRLRKPQKVAMHWAALKVTTKFSECSPLRRSQKKASVVMWRYFWPRGNLLASPGVLPSPQLPNSESQDKGWYWHPSRWWIKQREWGLHARWSIKSWEPSKIQSPVTTLVKMLQQHIRKVET